MTLNIEGVDTTVTVVAADVNGSTIELTYIRSGSNDVEVIRVPRDTIGIPHSIGGDGVIVGGGGGGAVDSVNGQTGDVTLDTDDVDEGSNNLYFTTTRADDRISLQKGSLNGLATLDGSGKIPSSQIPAIAITDTFVVGSEAAMLALTAETGDVAIRTDEDKSYILQAEPATVLGNWIQLSSPPAPVSSVNGYTGTVNLMTGDIAESGTNYYYTEIRFDTSFGTKTTDDLTEGSTNKYYSSSLFNTDFNSKVSGTTGYVPVFTGTNAIGNSLIQQTSGRVHVNSTDDGTTRFQINNDNATDSQVLKITNSNATGSSALISVLYRSGATPWYFGVRQDSSGTFIIGRNGFGFASSIFKLNNNSLIIDNATNGIRLGVGLNVGLLSDFNSFTSNILLSDTTAKGALRIQRTTVSSEDSTIQVNNEITTQSVNLVFTNTSNIRNFRVGFNGSASTTAVAGSTEEAGYLGTSAILPIIFFTNNIETMRISASNRVLIGTTTDDGTNKLQVTGSAIVTSLTLRTTFDQIAISAPSVSAAGVGRIYFDENDNKFKVSENGGAYVDLLSISGGDEVTGTLTTGYIPVASGANTLIDSTIIQVGSRIGIGLSDPLSTSALHINSSATDTLLAERNGNTLSGPSLTTYKTRGTHTSPTDVAANDILLILKGSGRYNLQQRTASSIMFVTESAPGPQIPSYIRFNTSTVNTFDIERMRITSGGSVLIGTTTSSSSDLLQVNGGALFNSINTSTSYNSSNVTNIPVWFKLTLSHTAFQAASTTNDINLLTLPSAGVVHAVKIKHSLQFTGTGMSSYTISVGITGNLTKYASAFDVFQAVTGTAFQLSNVVQSENHNSSVSVRIAATSNVNLDQSTAGTVEVWVLLSRIS